MSSNVKIFFLLSAAFFSKCLSSPIDPYVKNSSQGNLDERDLGRIITPKVQYAKKGEKVCMKELGCFELTADFFHLIYRPINVLPYDRVTIDTKFHLFTKNHPKEFHNLRYGNMQSVKNADINPEVPTVFIIHGFLEYKLFGTWMHNMKDHLLLAGDYNVILVDWSGGNGMPYTQAAANSRVVGAEIALMITNLENYHGISPKDCHIIGHSLGSHIAAYVGKRLKNLGRISGLDPAEPYFQNMPKSIRLDSSDAEFVDVIHTDAKTILLFGLGMSQACGHVDFYPNEGKNQPGCKTNGLKSILTDGLADAIRRFATCNHQRSVDFFTHSINYKKALPVGYECPSWNDYLNGKCAECGRLKKKCAVLGMQAIDYKPLKNNSRSVKLYLSTSASPPFWVYHYQLTVKLYKPNKGSEDGKGKITVVLHGTRRTVEFNSGSKGMDLYHGSTYNFLVTSDVEIGTLRSVNFSWESTTLKLLKTQNLYLEKIKVAPMNIIDTEERNKAIKTFCDTPTKAIKSKTSLSLTKTTCT